MSISQSIANKLRWEKVPKEERSRRMSELAKLAAIKLREADGMRDRIDKMVRAKRLLSVKKKHARKNTNKAI